MQQPASVNRKTGTGPLARVALRSLLALAISLSLLPPAPVQAQGLPTLGDTERESLSPLMERKLGEEIMRDIRRDRDYISDMP